MENLESKECKWCGEVKPLDEFYSFNKTKQDGEKYVYYNPECKECRKEASTKWRKENRESFLDIQKRRNKHPDHKKELKIAYKRRKEENYYMQYYYNNKEKFKHYRELHRHHDINNDEWENCKRYFNYQCAYCGIDEKTAKKEQGNYLHKEHVAHNGANDLSNCVPSCRVCNSHKWVFEWKEWYSVDNPDYTKIKFNKIVKWLNHDYLNFIEAEQII
ncbi:HNH endonuclease [Aquibacillus saliphilus]|uniref:HNH endonuclease n=1 Tax=Aquibacillus saliphilus TaxID=1909422 RepID=UPI001CF0A873|nr:HNH endonuclease signature motif containing protein [Aquibacillus saliphilus]